MLDNFNNKIIEIIKSHKSGQSTGLYSVCSANPDVVRAAIRQAQSDESLLLIEATSNQVDQFGGYTGMTPVDFYDFVKKLANQENFEMERIFLGGDHLGPNVWQNKTATEAMALAKDQIAAYVKAGFSKIHLDASMPLGDERKIYSLPLDSRLVAERAAELCAAAEECTLDGVKPVYVIGTDVPIPGGAQESADVLRITQTHEVSEVVEATREAFYRKGLDDAWERVIAVVVQPGVEFGDDTIIEYDTTKAQSLCFEIEKTDQLVYEAHSTDYQTAQALRQMVIDHFAILKVGPALTFAYREAIFSLSLMEKEFLLSKKETIISKVSEILEKVMLANPQYWTSHYYGTLEENNFARKFSYSDRIRYYWPDESVQKEVNLLINNLEKYTIPLSLLSEFMPVQYKSVREGKIENNPLALIIDKIRETLSIYAMATQQAKNQIEAVIY